jgi:hypothetical protein
MKQKKISTSQILLLGFVLLPCSLFAQGNLLSNEVIQFSIEKPEAIQHGKEFQVDFLFSIKPEWYIYAPTGNNAAQGMIETKVVFRLPEGITRAGKIKLPEPLLKNGYEVYEGKDIRMSQTLKAASTLKPGQYEIKGKVTWQTCSTDLCLPPETEEISALITVR